MAAVESRGHRGRALHFQKERQGKATTIRPNRLCFTAQPSCQATTILPETDADRGYVLQGRSLSQRDLHKTVTSLADNPSSVRFHKIGLKYLKP